MAEKELVKSGIPEMDAAIPIAMGDNLVWQVSNLDEFRLFAGPFIEQAIRDGRKIIYVRFASHPPLVHERKEVKRVTIPLSKRFESFTVDIHNLISREGPDVFYIFDCLSELQTAWATDLMMGNFFRLTCPYLYQMNTVTYFPILRGRHSFAAMGKIRDTTQLFLDVYSNAHLVFVRPLKVWKRSSETMFLPHLYDPERGTFRPVFSGVLASRFYSIVNRDVAQSADFDFDSWDRFFHNTQLLHQNGIDISDACSRMCHIMLTRDERMRTLIEENFTPEDYFEIRSRMIGTGLIGGKACGMLLARKLIENKEPDVFSRLEPHDSFYVGSDVFYTYLVDNGLWDLRLKQRTPEGYFTVAEEMGEALGRGTFNESMREQFRHVLDYYGQDPCIVRSSSILEDGFGNAFAGKYESVFCSNSGTPEERLREFENAIRTVYKSTMSMAALDYRKRRGLENRDEQMSLLVQRVSGSRYGTYFLPSAAGVGYSVSPYRFHGKEQGSGMLRLVMGLGTAAVDRERGSYPRIVSMDNPSRPTAATTAEQHQFSQQVIDAVNTSTGSVDGLDIRWAVQNLPASQQKMLLSHDYDAESRFLNRGQRRKVYFVSCDGIVQNPKIMSDMRKILETLQREYDYPVDIEYTINLSEQEYVIDLLQCRPLQVSKNSERVEVPEQMPREKVLLESTHASMGISRRRRLDYLVYVNPVAYYNMPYKEKYEVRTVIREINWRFRGQGKMMMLLVPGRICTSSPELGVPTTFADISEFDIIGEIAESRAGYQPELSYGSHIFQDLVESEILYTAVFADEKTLCYQPELLSSLPTIPNALDPVVKTYDLTHVDCTVYYDFLSEHFLCTLF